MSADPRHNGNFLLELCFMLKGFWLAVSTLLGISVSLMTPAFWDAICRAAETQSLHEEPDPGRDTEVSNMAGMQKTL
jgi:hypothetical protein